MSCDTKAPSHSSTSSSHGPQAVGSTAEVLCNHPCGGRLRPKQRTDTLVSGANLARQPDCSGDRQLQSSWAGEHHRLYSAFEGMNAKLNNLKVHPIPPHRNPSTDPWGLSNFTNTTYHNSYHPLFEIDSFMDHLAALYPEHVSLYELGHSAEGREMLAMHIHGGYSEGENVDTKRKTGTPNGKKGFVIMGAQHAREVCSVVDLSSLLTYFSILNLFSGLPLPPPFTSHTLLHPTRRQRKEHCHTC